MTNDPELLTACACRIASRSMGQMVSVVQKPSTIPGVVRFESNRTLTGQGHERFSSPTDAIGPRPAAELARRLLSTGQVESVHMFSNIITVNLHKGFAGEGLGDIVRELFQFWKPGMTPSYEEPAAVEGAAPAAAVEAGGDGGGAGESDYTRLVPANLIERSRAALAKWKATHGS
jgi:hypothetical protein